MARTYPPWILIARLLGTASLVGALAVALSPRSMDPRLGFVFLSVFIVLRVGSEWWLALRYPDTEGRQRRSAILNTLIAAGVVAFWFYVRRRGL